jgi:calcium-dependent protein kinase
LFEDLDVNESGKIDYVEFISAAMKNETAIIQEKLKAAFRLFDVNQDGYISKEEVEKVFKSDDIEELNWSDLLE